MKAADCRKPIHEFGWLIHLIITLLTLAYFIGGQTAIIAALDKRVGNVETTVTQILLEKNK